MPPRWKNATPGLRASVFPCDLADEASLDTLVSHLDSLPPGRTLLINNAGAGDYGEFADGRWEKIRALLRLNVESLTRLCHALIPSMKRNGGDIINLSSLGALLPIPDFAVYAATKAYVSSLSEALRLELREHGIRTRTRRKLSEGSSEIIDALRQGHVSYVINTIDINQHNTRLDGYEIRRTAVENNVTIFTALETVQVLLTCSKRSPSESRPSARSDFRREDAFRTHLFRSNGIRSRPERNERSAGAVLRIKNRKGIHV